MMDREPRPQPVTTNVPALLVSDYSNLIVIGNNLYAIHLHLVSPHFLPVHWWSDENRNKVLKLADKLAERIRGIHLIVPTSLDALFKSKTVPEIEPPLTDYQFLHGLMMSTMQARSQLVQTIGLINDDLGTQEILIRIEQFYAQLIWFTQAQGIEVKP
jgi:DNA-binding ferritin-like protein